MERSDFITIIKKRSIWRIDRRIGNYKLPNGERLSNYVRNLVESQMALDNLQIAKSGDLFTGKASEWDKELGDFTPVVIMPPFQDNETVSFEQHERRISALVSEIVG